MSTSISSSPSPLDIPSVLAEFDSSGQSAASFARSKGLAPWKLYGALRRRSGKPRIRRSASSTELPAFLPLRVVDSKPASSPAPLELVLAGGHHLLIGPDFDAVILRRLLAALAPC